MIRKEQFAIYQLWMCIKRQGKMHAIVLTMPPQPWVKKQNRSAFLQRSSSGLRGGSAWLAAWWSHLPLAARMCGLAREAPVLSSKSVTSAPVGPPKFLQPAPSAGLVCLPCLAVPALSETGSPSCVQTKLLITGNHCSGTWKTTLQLSHRPSKRLRYYKSLFSSSRQLNLAKQSPPSFPAEWEWCISPTASRALSWCCFVCCLQFQANYQLWNWQSRSLGNGGKEKKKKGEKKGEKKGKWKKRNKRRKIIRGK